MIKMDAVFMQRCLQLASLGEGYVAPNPLVGAVLVFENRIIGEGFHQQFGQAHAEVNCLASVKETDRALIAASTLYVSLEPCDHQGKTPPCTALIIEAGIKKVKIGCIDHSSKVNGKGIKRLVDAGIDVQVGVLADACHFINRRFFFASSHQQTYVVLKWAQSADGYLGISGQNVKISNSLSDRIVHRLRARESAIMVGYQTALTDDPYLSVRLAPGPNPVRVVSDRDLSLPASLHLFDHSQPTIIFNEQVSTVQGLNTYVKTSDVNAIDQLMKTLYAHGILSVLIEGGAGLLRQCIAQNCWNEAIVINGKQLMGKGLPAPSLPKDAMVAQKHLLDDGIFFYQNKQLSL